MGKLVQMFQHEGRVRAGGYYNVWGQKYKPDRIRYVVNIAIELATFRVFVIIVHEITLKELSTNLNCNLIAIAKKA